MEVWLPILCPLSVIAIPICGFLGDGVSLVVIYGSTATLITPSSFPSNTR